MKKQFSLEYYLEHPETKVVTREGVAVRIICTDDKSTIGCHVVGLLRNKCDYHETAYRFSDTGRIDMGKEDPRDLFFDLPDPVKKKVALNYDDLVERVKAGKTMWISVGNDPVEMYQITSFDDEGVSLDQFGRELEDLLIFNYHFADGDPCWKEVDE